MGANRTDTNFDGPANTVSHRQTNSVVAACLYPPSKYSRPRSRTQLFICAFLSGNIFIVQFSHNSAYSLLRKAVSLLVCDLRISFKSIFWLSL